MDQKKVGKFVKFIHKIFFLPFPDFSPNIDFIGLQKNGLALKKRPFFNNLISLMITA